MDADTLIASLHQQVRGTVRAPADPDFDLARLAWARVVDQHPAAVVTPADVADLQAVVDVARSHGATVAVQPTGHGASGDLQGAILIRMDAFTEIEIDPGNRVAKVGAGVLIGDLLAALDATGLVGPTGSSRVVSVPGFVLGNGQGWFSRLGGLGGQWVRAVELVKPDGALERVDDESAPQTMRLLRGGGGLVGIATSLEIELLPVTDLRGGSFSGPIEQTAEVLAAAAPLIEAPAGLGLSISLLQMPEASFLPEAIRGRSSVEVSAVLADVPDDLLSSLRLAAQADPTVLSTVTPGQLYTVSNDPEGPARSTGWSALVPQLDQATIEALVAARADPLIASVIAIEIRLLGPLPAARPSLVDPPAAYWLLYSVAPIPDGTDGIAQHEAVARLARRLAPVTIDRTLPTFLGTGALSRALSPDALEQLRGWRATHEAAVLHPSRLSE